MPKKTDAKMTEAQFVEKFNGAPWDDQQLVEEAAKVDGELGQLARTLRAAKSAFDSKLEALGFEVG